MPEIQKYNLRQELERMNEVYENDPAIVGASGMTFFPYNNSMRTNMFTSHTNQFINMKNPEFAYLFTGLENTAGRNSSGYKKAKGKWKIFRKVEKFASLVEKPFFYQLFYWDEDMQQYDVIERKEVEDLGQDFGFPYQNEVIDSLVEGQTVEAGTIVAKSNSYRNGMNYGYGMNLNVAYTFDPFEYEDGATIHEGVYYRGAGTISYKNKWGWNDNDIPLNLYGGEEEYRPLPWIGETITGIIASARPKINEQELYDFKHDNLRRVNPDSDRTQYYNGTGMVIDYDIFCNTTEIPRTSFNAQILMLVDAQNRYWKKIQETCLEIFESGKPFSHDVDLLYKKSYEMLERRPNYKWNNGSSVFGNFEIRIHILEYPPLTIGGKITGRYGNKSVVTRVLPKYMMPFTKDGRHVDVLLAIPAIPNRTTGFIPHELEGTWMFGCARRKMAKSDKEEKEKILFDLLGRMNKDFCEYQMGKYKALTAEEQEAYLQKCIDVGIFAHLDMINHTESTFDKLKRANEELDYLEPDTLYVYRFGHVYRLYQQFHMGSMYMLPLKQTDKRGFSARATGAINLKGLPERSYKNKRGEAPFSDTAVRFGEYEALMMLTGMEPEDIVATQAMYRTSPEASEDLTRAQFEKRCRGFYKNFYKSMPAEIMKVYFMHLGVEPVFSHRDNEVKAISNDGYRPHVNDKGEVHLCTDYEFHMRTIMDRIKAEILLEKPVLTEEQLQLEINERFKNYPVLARDYPEPLKWGPDEIIEPEAPDPIFGKQELLYK